MERYPEARLLTFCLTVCGRFGLDPGPAEALSRSLLFAECRGVSSHGLIRLPQYMTRIEKGLTDPRAEMAFVMEQDGTALLDARNGLGQLAGRLACAKALELARRYGVSHVGVRNSNHFGTGAWYSIPAAQAGFIAFNFSNASPAIAPWGAREPLLGTNPIGVAVPCGDRRPIVVDMALSEVSRGKVRLSALDGRKIPLTWGLDETGRPTDDPEAALRGSLCPIGGPKGSALSFLLDLLCGVLTGTGLTGEARGVTDTRSPGRTGHVFGALDVSRFMDPVRFGALAAECADRLRAAAPVRPGELVLAPGDPEYLRADQCAREGVPLSPAVLAALNALAGRAGCETL